MTPRRKRPFYVIAHNPNTIEEAEAYLQAGVNALEPDIVHVDGQFYISHAHHRSYDDVPTLESYLTQLKALLLEKNYPLALMIFDIKDTDFDINTLVGSVKQYFHGGVCDGVALVFTHSDDHEFIARYDGAYPNVGVGVDESNVPPVELEQFFRGAGQKNFTYADGITTFLAKPGVYGNVRAAQHCRNTNNPGSFGLIYTWVLSLRGSIQKYLDIMVDGIFVDVDKVPLLNALVTTAPYDAVYELAANGYNPFAAAPMPNYILEIKTCDHYLAGTDAHMLFTLKSTAGDILQSLPYDGSLLGALESGTTTRVVLEGKDLGAIESLTVEALTSDINSDWLPESVTVTSQWLEAPLTFVFNGEGMEETWITKKGGPVTRQPKYINENNI